MNSLDMHVIRGINTFYLYNTTPELEQQRHIMSVHFLSPQHFVYFVRSREQGAKPRASINKLWKLFADTAGLRTS